MIPGLAEYVDIGDRVNLLTSLYNQVKGLGGNTFGKTAFTGYSLEDNKTGEPNGNEVIYEPILSEHRKVHPYTQGRSTGFNAADSTEKDVFAHSDVDYHLEHPNYFNIVIPILGASRIDYFETDPDEIYLPELDAHGHSYYHEFKVQKEMGQGSPEFEKYLSDRKIGHIIVDKPLLLDTNTMHRVVVTEAPRCAWVTRWNNIPKEIDYHTFKDMVESIL